MCCFQRANDRVIKSTRCARSPEASFSSHCEDCAHRQACVNYRIKKHVSTLMGRRFGEATDNEHGRYVFTNGLRRRVASVTGAHSRNFINIDVIESCCRQKMVLKRGPCNIAYFIFRWLNSIFEHVSITQLDRECKRRRRNMTPRGLWNFLSSLLRNSFIQFAVLLYVT